MSTTDSDSRSGLVLELAEEFLDRYRKGQRPALKEYIDRHPHLAAEIREVFPAMAMMEHIALADESMAGDPTGDTPPRKPSQLKQLGDYRILREIGRGGMGVVYEAEQISLGRHVALKLLPPQMLRDSKQRQRFEREAKAAARLHHTNIVPVFGVGEQDETPYYVMQYIQGLGLDEVLDQLKRMQARPDVPIPADTGIVLKVSRGDVSAVEVARSLLTGRFEPADARDDAHSPAQPTATATLGHPTLTMADSPDSSRSSRPSDPPSLSSSSLSVMDTGSGEVARKTSAKPPTYWQSVARIGVQVADALDYAHKQGIVHRDIKPSNLLLDTRGTVWVADFGLAKSSDQQNLTHTGDLLGTLRYMPPEAFEGKSGALGDVYSLGLTLYELLALRPAFGEKDRGRLIQQVTTAEADRLGKLNHEIPRDLDTIVHKAIERDPSHRYPSPGNLAADLQRFLDDEPIQARRLSHAERVGRWSRRHKAVASLLAALFLVLSVGLVVTTTFWRISDANAQTLSRQVYINKLNLAYREALANNVVLADRLLDECDPAHRGWEWRYCRRLCHLEMRTLGGFADHAAAVAGAPHGVVSAAVFSPDGRWIASAGEDGVVSLWDVTTGREVRTLTGHDGPVNCVAFSRDGRIIASGGDDKTIRLWDTETGSRLKTLRNHTEPVTCVAFSPIADRIVSGTFGELGTFGRGTEFKLWDSENGRVIRTFFHQPGWEASSVAYSADGRRFATITRWGQHIRVWNASDAEELKVVHRVEADEHDGIAFSPTDERIAMGSRDAGVMLWDPATETVARYFHGHTGAIMSVAFDKGGQKLATASMDGTVKVWDVATSRLVANLRGHTGPVLSARFSPDGRHLVSAGRDKTIKLWDLASQATYFDYDPNGWAFVVRYSPNGRIMAISHYNHLSLLDAETGRPTFQITYDREDLLAGEAVAFSPKGRRIAITHRGLKTVELRETEHGRQILTLEGHAGPVRGLAFSPSGQRIATASEDGTIKIWDPVSGQATLTLRGHKAEVFGVTYHPDGNRLASISFDGIVKLWDAATGRELRSFPGVVPYKSKLRNIPIAFDQRGGRIAATSVDGTIRVWDVTTGRTVFILRGHTKEVYSVAFSPDGQRIASSSEDGTIKLWDSATGEEVFTLRGHGGGVLEITYSPNGQRIASAGTDGTVRVWDATPLPDESLSREHPDSRKLHR